MIITIINISEAPWRNRDGTERLPQEIWETFPRS